MRESKRLPCSIGLPAQCLHEPRNADEPERLKGQDLEEEHGMQLLGAQAWPHFEALGKTLNTGIPPYDRTELISSLLEMWEGGLEIDETEILGSCWSNHWEALIKQEWGCRTAVKEIGTRLVLPGDHRFSGKGVMMSPSSEVVNSKITRHQGW